MAECFKCGDELTEDDQLVSIDIVAVKTADGDVTSVEKTGESVLMHLRHLNGAVKNSSPTEGQGAFYCGYCGKACSTDRGTKIHQGNMHPEKDYKVLTEPPDEELDEEDSDPDTHTVGKGHDKQHLEMAEEVEEDDDGDVCIEDEDVVEAFENVANAVMGKREESMAKALVKYFESKDKKIFYIKSRQISKKLDGMYSAQQISTGFAEINDNPEDYSIDVSDNNYSGGTTWKVVV